VANFLGVLRFIQVAILTDMRPDSSYLPGSS
jgi:hypothetical protein